MARYGPLIWGLCSLGSRLLPNEVRFALILVALGGHSQSFVAALIVHDGLGSVKKRSMEASSSCLASYLL